MTAWNEFAAYLLQVLLKSKPYISCYVCLILANKPITSACLVLARPIVSLQRKNYRPLISVPDYTPHKIKLIDVPKVILIITVLTDIHCLGPLLSA